jgi:hypothetical protein
MKVSAATEIYYRQTLLRIIYTIYKQLVLPVQRLPTVKTEPKYELQLTEPTMGAECYEHVRSNVCS